MAWGTQWDHKRPYKCEAGEFPVVQRIKGLVLSLLWCGFDLWPRNFCMPWVWPKKKEGGKGPLRERDMTTEAEVRVMKRPGAQEHDSLQKLKGEEPCSLWSLQEELAQLDFGLVAILGF